MFEQVFTAFYEKNREIKAIGVWGKDGLELEKKYFAKLENTDVDLEFSGAEVAEIVARLDRTKISPKTFFMKLYLKKYLLIIHSLTADYFLLILCDPEIIEGKLKFYLNLYNSQFIAAL